jgi:hypothetical protein
MHARLSFVSTAHRVRLLVRVRGYLLNYFVVDMHAHLRTSSSAYIFHVYAHPYTSMRVDPYAYAFAYADGRAGGCASCISVYEYVIAQAARVCVCARVCVYLCVCGPLHVCLLVHAYAFAQACACMRVRDRVRLHVHTHVLLVHV